MSWQIKFTVKPGDPYYSIIQEQALFNSFETIAKIHDTGRYCFEYGKYIFENTDPDELAIINKYQDFFKNAALSMLNTFILEVLKLLAPGKSNDAYSLQKFIKQIIKGDYGTTNANSIVLSALNTELAKVDSLYAQARKIRDKVIAHTDPDRDERFSVKIINELYLNVFVVLKTLAKQLYNLDDLPYDYQPPDIKQLLKDLRA